MTLSAAVATAAALAASKSLAETAATPLACPAAGSRGDSVWCTFRNFFSVTFILSLVRECGPRESGRAGGRRASVRAAVLLLHAVVALAAITTPFGSLLFAAAADRSLIYTVMAPNWNLFLLLSVRNSGEREALDYLLTFPDTPRRGTPPNWGCTAHKHAATTPRNGGPLQRQRPQFVFVSAGRADDRPIGPMPYTRCLVFYLGDR